MPTAVGEEQRNALAGRERSENVIVVGHGFVCIGWPPCRAECSCVLYELQSVSDGQPMHTTGASGSGAPCGNCNVVVTGAVRNGWNRPRQFVVALEESPTQYDFPSAVR